MKTFRYIPLAELVAFFLIAILTVVFYLTTGFHKAILVVTILTAYIFILGGANFVKLKNGKISITYCYILIWKDVVDLKDVVKLESQETFKDESIDPEISYYEFRRAYQLEFRDKKGRLKKLHFKIGHKGRESEVVAEIKNALQRSA